MLRNEATLDEATLDATLDEGLFNWPLTCPLLSLAGGAISLPQRAPHVRSVSLRCASWHVYRHATVDVADT